MERCRHSLLLENTHARAFCAALSSKRKKGKMREGGPPTRPGV